MLKTFVRLSKCLSRKGLEPFLRQHASSIPSGARVLSIGSGGTIGDLLHGCAENVGFSLDELDIDPAREPDIVADLCSWTAEEPYDVIFLSEVLEHVHSPHIAIANLEASLKPRGHLIATTPFALPIHDGPRDYYRYTRYGLKHLLCDFDEVTVQERNNWGEAVAVLLARTFSSENIFLVVISPFFILLALLLYPICWLAGKIFPSRFLTTGYLITARKK